MTAPISKAWKTSFVVPHKVADAFADALSDLCEALSTTEVAPGGDWRIDGFSRQKPEPGDVTARLALTAALVGIPAPEASYEAVPDTDWVRATYESFPPLQIGRFYVHGSHVDAPPPVGSVALLVDAAIAFGSGEHASTQGCLLALSDLAKARRPVKSLDMGCGSGILAMAMAKQWRRPVDAVDIDADSVRVTIENARANGCDQHIAAVAGDGYRVGLVRGKQYDVICSNILARPLMKFAPMLRRHLKPGGVAVLAGLLRRQESAVLSAHRAQGLVLARRIPMGEWGTLVLRRPHAA
ncbi:MAG TPA: 50S ribosomal protein L11 methyltransferase [Alphaproteobacteria bacterium]|nr:50S ribosomal protein L11 methyltransferase [Alphaproteobacteria bacterium]